MKSPLGRSVGASAAALLASSATLVCCVLPAVMVSLGLGAVLAGLVSNLPQLVWLSERKGAVFAVAGVMLLVSGLLLRHAARLPCPADPAAASACLKLRRWSSWLFWTAVIAYAAGGGFVLLAPRLIGA